MIDPARDCLDRPRRPGLRFEATPPAPTRILPRMDVAAFVGFAATGPFDHPIAVEDLASFTATFGGEVTLVHDAVRGTDVTGQLRGAVEAFFRNGGRRCWVVRVPGPGPKPHGRPGELKPITGDLFLDDALSDASVHTLLGTADLLRFGAAENRALRGIYSLLSIDEVSLLAVPDASLPTWAPPIGAPPPAVHPDCPDVELRPAPEAAPTDTFDACQAAPPRAPDMAVVRGEEPTTFRLTWQPVADADSYVVESRVEPWEPVEPSTPTTNEPGHAVVDASPGWHAYRVRSVGPGGASPWSERVRVHVDLTPEYEVAARDTRTALAVHAAMLRISAARGDLFAILSLPEAARPDEVLAHVAALRERVTGTPPASDGTFSADLDPLAVLSYGAIYAPWLLLTSVADRERQVGAIAADATRRASGETVRPPTTATRRPPDGTIAGVFAERAITRGAWVAPANVELRDVVGLAVTVSGDDGDRLYDGHVNAVRPTPWGFRCRSSQTVSLDATFRPLTVRRLLSLLRRLAMLHGVDYVFEPNSDAFRRRIQRGFEAILAGLFERGAFAGDRADAAFRVVVGAPPNTAQSIDAGHLIVELKVAPSTPLEYLTVRLVRSGDRFAFEVA